MFGVPFYGPSDVMCDKQRAVNNAIMPQYNLGKKHNAVNYYVLKKASAEGILRVSKEDTETNLADLMTKILSWQQHHKLIPFVLYSS